jgi:hypothetical protein
LHRARRVAIKVPLAICEPPRSLEASVLRHAVRSTVVLLFLAACSESTDVVSPDPAFGTAPTSSTVILPGSIGVTNPCNGEFVTGPTTVGLSVHQVLTPSGNASVVVRRTVWGTVTGSLGNSYKFSSDAKETFKSAAATYDLPYYAVAATSAKGASFAISGSVRVNVSSDGAPTGSLTLSLDATCS